MSSPVESSPSEAISLGGDAKPVATKSKFNVLGWSILAILAILAVTPTIAFYGWSFLHFGTFKAGGAWLRGDPVHVLESVVDLGERPAGERAEAACVVWNFSRDPVRILGSRTSCSCVVIDGLPMTIPPRSKKAIRVDVAVDSEPESFEQKAAFYTDQPEVEEFIFRVVGRGSASS
jgi:hypothetical protein